MFQSWLSRILVGGLVSFLFLPRPAARAAGRPSQSWNLLLISIDTLRADHLGAYGFRRSVTPHLNALARQSVLFSHAITPVPLTLPAHAALMTSEYPPVNGARDNGEALPGSVPTLAEQLRAHGFQTAAFVASFILDRRFGLARGFDEYWGDFHIDRHPGLDPGSIMIRGDQVEQAANEWIVGHASKRFFAFVHFYDLHGPYLMPAPWRERFRDDPYDGELAYVDDLIGRLWASLAEKGIARRTLLVIIADHGESLGDHGEWNHGFFVYQSTIHVPLLIRFPDGRFAGTRIPSVVSLIDIAPTACSILDVPAPARFQGHDLVPEIEGRGTSFPHLAYSETLYPMRHFDTAPLFALTDARYEYILASRPELYDLRGDEQEKNNLASKDRALAASYRQRLTHTMAAMRPRHNASIRLRPDELELLTSLGYVATASGPAEPGGNNSTLPDPKDRIALYRKFQCALELENRGDIRESAIRLEQVAAQDPKMVSVEVEAGLARQRLHEDSKAIADFRMALKAQPGSALAHYDLGISLGNLHYQAQAERELLVATELEPSLSQAYTARGLDLANSGKLQEAISSLSEAIRIDPTDFTAQLNRGKMEMLAQEWRQAGKDLAYAEQLEPKNASAHEALGTLAFYGGQLRKALEEYGTAVRLNPYSSPIHSSLGLLYLKLGRKALARAEFQRALALDPHNGDARKGLSSLR
jgi:arylsulfatase A-like enzyme/Flp pilus assembly protein TadD